MTTYRMTDKELELLLEASKSVTYIVIGGIEPRSPSENAMDVWKKISERVGCDPNSIESANTGDNHDFKATPIK